MSAPAIEAKALTKRYGELVAVDGLDLTIGAGEVFGLLGPNGSGKTTTILMIMGLTEVNGGSVRVLGLDPARRPLEIKRQVGYMPDTVGFYEQLSARDNLRYTGRLAGVPRSELDARIDTAIERVRLSASADKRVAAFSRGMRQRLGLADVLVKQPSIAILDEPTGGLDPQSSLEFLGLIRNLKADGITVLLSSHLLDRVQAVCDRVGLFRDGRMVLEGTVNELAGRVLGSGHRLAVEARGQDLEKAFRSVPGIVSVTRDGGDRYVLEAEADVRPQVAARVAESGGQLLGLGTFQPSLEAVYTRYFEGGRDAA